MPATLPILSRLSFVGLGKEVTPGTAVAPTFFVPATTLKPQDVVGMADDTSIEGNAAKLQGSYQTIKDSAYALDCLAYFETVGNYFVAAGWSDSVAVGRSVADGVDSTSITITSATAAFVAGDVGATITGTDIPVGTTILSVTNATTAVLTAATTGTGVARAWVLAGGTGTFQHKFALNSAQPPAYSITDFDGFETLVYPGSALDQLDFNIDAKAEMKVMTQWKGWPATTASKPTPAYPTLPPGLGWQAAYTIGGVVIPRLESVGMTLKRNTDVIHTSQGTQNPYNVFEAEAEVAIKIKGIRVDDTERNHLLNNDQPSFVATITSPTGTPSPVLTMTASKTAWKKAPPDRSGKFMQGDYDLECIYNSSDAGPCKFVLTNGTAAAY